MKLQKCLVRLNEMEGEIYEQKEWVKIMYLLLI